MAGGHGQVLLHIFQVCFLFFIFVVIIIIFVLVLALQLEVRVIRARSEPVRSDHEERQRGRLEEQLVDPRNGRRQAGLREERARNLPHPRTELNHGRDGCWGVIAPWGIAVTDYHTIIFLYFQ